jgi:excinuclease UvrABC nuclease subunit
VRVSADLETLFDQAMTLPDPAEPLEKSTLPSGGGVYALLDGRGAVLQTIGTQSLKRSIYHRLCPPADDRPTRKVDLRAIAREIRWRPTHSVFETYFTYLTVSRRLRPDRYRKELAFGPVWFAQIHPAERFPRWQADTLLAGGDGVDVGPFSDRRHCAVFVELLEDLFDLCRKHEILQQAPHGKPCVYFEMGKCPAPCDGSISLEEYSSMLDRSLAFATGGHGAVVQALQERMRSTAADQAFEEAGRIKSLIERVQSVLRSDGRVTTTPGAFRFLVVQRGGGTSRIKPFFVRGGAIEVGEPIRFKELESAVPEWLQRMAVSVMDETGVDRVFRSECIWLVSHFILRKEKAPGLFLPTSELSSAEGVIQQIRERFRRPDRASENMRDTGTAEPEVDSQS